MLNEGLEALGTDEHTQPGVFEKSGIHRVRLPSTLRRIGYSAFEDCKDLRDVALPDGLERIGERCFCGAGIKRITLPPSTRTIGASVFFGCTRLRSVALNEGLTSLGASDDAAKEGYAFAKSGLESITVSSSLQEIPKNSFWECESLREVRFAEGLQKIGRGAFEESGLVEVVFPASLRTVSQRAFRGCRGLRTVKFGEGLETLGTDEFVDGSRPDFGVFEGSAVENVQFPSTLRRVEYSTFERCENLKSIRLPRGLERIGQRCFYESGLEAVTFPLGLRAVGAYAFRGCEGLHSATLNEGLQVLGERITINGEAVKGSVFAGSGLRKITIPSTLREIPEETFLRCRDLREVHLGEGLEKVGLSAFQETGLRSVALPPSLRMVAQGAFCRCERLRSVSFCDGLEVLGTDERPRASGRYFGVFERSALKRVRLPRTLRRIEYGAFEDCRDLKSVKFPEVLGYIGADCFRGCWLEKVVFPSALEEIGQRAFYGNALRKICFGRGSRLRVVGDCAFGDNVPLDCEAVRFPAGAKESESVFECGSGSEVSAEEDEECSAEEIQEELLDYSF